MVVSGVPEPLEDHARCICQLALDMKEAAEEREKLLGEDDIHVTITIGIHTGEVRVGGIRRKNLEQVPQRHTRCDYLVVTHCNIQYVYFKMGEKRGSIIQKMFVLITIFSLL